MDCFFVLGTRPEIVKLAPIIHECERRDVSSYILHTGQHYSQNMSSAIFEDLELRPPDRDLSIGSGTHAEQTAYALLGIEKELVSVRPKVVVAQGDTNAVLSAALAAIKLGIRLAHVEAGLRSYDRRMPEEHNRRLTDHASDYLFAPTEHSARILREEKVWGEVFVTGNTVIDAIEAALPRARKKSRILSDLDLKGRDFVLLTLHRAENVDDRSVLNGLIRGIMSLDREVVFAAHPRTVSRLKEFGLMSTIESAGTIRVIPPPSYLDFLVLLQACRFVLTDSGGIQEEATAPSVNKSVFVLRTSTERPEAVESGHASVVGVDPASFPQRILEDLAHEKTCSRRCPFGDGRASRTILDILQRRLG
ncbi:MAG: UDP-N-acetylglucosamine 2-epimerase (non-hydrolyzing) [Candidatus Thorarchaeota archaeon]|nr:UDP-N-acetylglucosamine 2-epimerase (non-hydrolyzing) [Candidatus Thorarchaeota archaeon]